jgi:hypothetical protein
VKPLERVVDWVVEGKVTGDAKPRLTGWMDFRAARLRRAWFRLKARRREAIVRVDRNENGGEGGRRDWREGWVAATETGWGCEVEVRKVKLFASRQPIT